MNISYLKAEWCSADKQSVLFTDLVIEGESFGNYIADTTSDLGKELLKYLKDKDVSVNLSTNQDPLPSINISKETAINNLTSWFKEFINKQVKTKYFIDANDCLSYLNSIDKELNTQAKAFLQWKETCFKIFRQFIADFKSNDITILNFTSDKLLEKLPTLSWEIVDDSDLDIDLSNINLEPFMADDDFLSKKAKSFNTLKDNYLKLKAYKNGDVYFTSSIHNLYVNGDAASKIDIEALLALNEGTNEMIHFKSYSNMWIDLTREEMLTIYKELLENQLNINQQYWSKTQQLLEAQNETELARVSLDIPMKYFGTLEEADSGL